MQLWQKIKSQFTLYPAVFFLVLLALGLRLPLLNSSFWLDEAAQAWESSRPLAQQLNIIPDFQPPLLHLISHTAIQISQQEWWLRTVGALVPGLITVAAVFVLGNKLFNRRTGLLAGLLLATNSFHIFFSQELRPYSLPAMLAVLSWLSLIGFINHTPKLKPPPLQLITANLAYILLTTAGLYSSYLYPFLLISQLVYVGLANRSLIKSYLLLLIPAVSLFLPWLPIFFQQLQAGQQLRTKLQGWENVVSLTQTKSAAITYGKFVFGVINIEINLLFISLSALITLLALIFILKLVQTPNKTKFYSAPVSSYLLAASWLLIPFITSWLVSFAVPVVRPKRLLYLLPAFYLLLSALIDFNLRPASTQIKSSLKNKLLPIILLIVLLGANFYSTYRYWTNPAYQRENWRSLHQEISQRFPENDTIAVFSFDQPFISWYWYNRGQYDSLATGAYAISDVPNLQQRLKPIFDYQFVLMFDYLRDLTDPQDKLPQTIESYGYQSIGAISRPNIGQVHIYTKEELLSNRAW